MLMAQVSAVLSCNVALGRVPLGRALLGATQHCASKGTEVGRFRTCAVALVGSMMVGVLDMAVVGSGEGTGLGGVLVRVWLSLVTELSSVSWGEAGLKIWLIVESFGGSKPSRFSVGILFF